MRSCTSPAGRLKSHQRDFWIETAFQMQKTKAWRWLFPGRHILIFWGTRSGNTRGKTWDLTRPCPSDLCLMTLSQVGFLTLAPGTVDCSPPCSPILGILQARILECAAMSTSRGIFLTQGLNLYLLWFLHCRWFFTTEPPGKSQPKRLPQQLIPYYSNTADRLLSTQNIPVIQLCHI